MRIRRTIMAGPTTEEVKLKLVAEASSRETLSQSNNF